MNNKNFVENDNNKTTSEEQENLSKVENGAHFPEWNENVQKNVVGYH